MLPTLRPGTLHKPASGGGYTPTDADAIAWFAASSTTYSDAEKLALNTYFSDLKAAALWAKFDRLWGFCFGNNSTDSRLDFKARLFVTAVNSPSWNLRRGFTGNGSSSYLNTGFVPSANGVNYALNSAIAGLYIRAYDTTTSGFLAALGCEDSSARRTTLTRDSNAAFQYVAVNEGAGAGASARAGNGFYCANRSSSTATQGYINATALTFTRNSLGLPAQPVFLSARNNNGTADRFGAFEISMAFFGSSFSETEWGSFRTITSTFLSAIGFTQP